MKMWRRAKWMQRLISGKDGDVHGWVNGGMGARDVYYSREKGVKE